MSAAADVSVRSRSSTGTLAEALEAALARGVGRHPDLVVVHGQDPGRARAAVEEHPTRAVRVDGPLARLAVAEGLALGGRRAVTVVDDLEPSAFAAALHGAAPQVYLGDAGGLARPAHAAGVAVVQPVWPGDAEVLLEAALGRGVPVLVRLAVAGSSAEARASYDPPEPSPDPHRPRVLCDGEAAVLVASGPGVPLARQIGRMLAGRGTRVRVLDLHTLTASWPVTTLDRALLFHPAPPTGRVPDPGTLAAVTFAGRAPRAVLQDVIELLEATDQAGTPGRAAGEVSDDVRSRGPRVG